LGEIKKTQEQYNLKYFNYCLFTGPLVGKEKYQNTRQVPQKVWWGMLVAGAGSA